VHLVDAEQFTVKMCHLTNQKINSLFLKIPVHSKMNLFCFLFWAIFD